MKKIKMSGELIRHHLCCLECGLIGEGEAAVADEGGDGEGENAMGNLVARKTDKTLNGKRFPTLGQSTNECDLVLFFFESIFIYRTYATSSPLYDIFLLLQQTLEVQICTSPTFASTPHPQQLKPTSYARRLRWRRRARRLLAVVERTVMADNSTARMTTMTTQLRRRRPQAT